MDIQSAESLSCIGCRYLETEVAYDSGASQLGQEAYALRLCLATPNACVLLRSDRV